MDTQTLTDEEIVEKVLHSDKNCFLLLVQRYESKIERYIRRFIYDIDDVSDVLQNVFVKVYTNLNSFDSDYKFNSWIYRIAHNESINYLKKNKKGSSSLVDIDTILPVLFAKETADSKYLSGESKDEIEKALKFLDSKYREIIVLSYFEDLEYKEISEVLQIPVSTVGVRLRRAKEKLKEQIEKHRQEKVTYTAT
jgi:RNA polymerase sigma-70 factor (ECF subfamily)